MSISEPGKIITPWASTGSKNPIPPNANNTTGSAGFDKGFPDITMTPEEAGGTPPAGQDFNGIFYQITDIIRYMQAGGQAAFSSSLSAAIGGYPKGALVLSGDGVTIFQNQTDGNTNNPNTSQTGWKIADVGLRQDLASASSGNGSALVNFTPSGVASALAKVPLQRLLEDAVNVRPFIAAYGVKGGIEAAIQWATPGTVYLPSGVNYTMGASETLNIAYPIHITGDRAPNYNFTTGDRSGSWIVGTIANSGLVHGIQITNLGVDSRDSTILEGIALGAPAANQQLQGVRVENVIVLGKPNNNHCCLIEGADDVIVRNYLSVSGIQGLAVKATNFLLDGIFGVDTVTWSLTIRESPGYLCRHGIVRNVMTKALNNSECGGVILMNDQPGAAMDDVLLDGITLDKGYFYATNAGNTTGQLKNARVRNLILRGRTGFAFQTFGDVQGLDVDGVTFDACQATFTTNDAAAYGFNLRNVKTINTLVPADLSGSNHLVSGWKNLAGAVPQFIINKSTGLQVEDMDCNVPSVLNTAGGTSFGPNSLVYPAQVGGIPRMRREPMKVAESIGNMDQNDSRPVFTQPIASQYLRAKVSVFCFSPAGSLVREFLVADDKVTAIGGSTASEAVIGLNKIGQDINFVYLYATSGSVYLRTELDVTYQY